VLKPLDIRELGKKDLIPQAIIRKPVAYFEGQGFGFVHDYDALDFFQGAAFLLDDLPFALIHHRGCPDNETTIYLTRDFSEDVGTITDSIRHILAALRLPSNSLVWERKDDPEL
jgi:hypothetical protein